MKTSLHITLAQPQHLHALPDIERSAAQLFVGWNVPDCVINSTTTPDEFAKLQHENLLWVALLDEKPVGFAIVEPEGDALHVDEIDVHPHFGKQGIGSAIVNTLCEWASKNNYRAVTLTTYRDIPWNAPFYQKLGFSVVPVDKLTESLRNHVLKEAAHGLDPTHRVVMQKIFNTLEYNEENNL